VSKSLTKFGAGCILFRKNPDILVITGCDETHYDLAADCVASFHECYPGACDFAFANFSHHTPPPAIAGHVTHLLNLPPPPEFAKVDGYFTAYSRMKARLPLLFPGYKIYIWVDADCWFQGAQSLPRIIIQAEQTNIAIHPEFDIHYGHYATPSDRTLKIYKRNEGKDLSAMPLDMPMLNTGVFAMRHDCGMWAAWQAELDRLHEKHRAGHDVYFSDQIALHKVIYTNRYTYGPLRAIDNWQTYACLPSVNLVTKKLIVPTPPYEEIGILHLAGKSKFETVNLDGKIFALRYQDFKRATQAA